ncbi:hypothetical protein PVAP13_9KG572950 [Panicum virgatum]|uniref:Uncharacterized protein n=1 Tax=Panicum virgatum TaxID=38727 RepID=A0A8T0NZW9_PANVG|nr:hypothetical protein PVAP13_9KG572950 [Panicum virgatum]
MPRRPCLRRRPCRACRQKVARRPWHRGDTVAGCAGALPLTAVSGLGGARRTAPPASPRPPPDGWLRQPDAQSGQTVLRGALGSFPVRPRRPNLRTAGLSFLLWNPSIGVYVHSMKTSKKTVDPSSVLMEY